MFGSEKSGWIWTMAVLLVGILVGATVSAVALRSTQDAALRPTQEDAREGAMRAKPRLHQPDARIVRYQPVEPLNGKGGEDLSGPYQPVLGWPQPLHPGEWRTGSGRAIYAESPDRVYVIHGGELPAYEEDRVWGKQIFTDLRYFTDAPLDKDGRPLAGRHEHEVVIYDRNGKLIDSWEQWNATIRGKATNLGHVNRLRVNRYDPERHIWIVGQNESETVFKFTHDGTKLVMTVDAKDVSNADQPQVLKGAAVRV